MQISNNFAIGKFMLALVFAGGVFVEQLASKEVEVGGIPYHRQEQRDTCVYACARMWLHHINGWAPSESEMVHDFGHGKHMLTMSEAKSLMERYTSKGFQVRKITSEKSARKRVYKEIRSQHRPFIVGASIRYRDFRHFWRVSRKIQKREGHALLVYAADVKTKKSNYKVKWVRVKDPLYWSVYRSTADTLSTRRIRWDEFLKYVWIGDGHSRKAVDD